MWNSPEISPPKTSSQRNISWACVSFPFKQMRRERGRPGFISRKDLHIAQRRSHVLKTLSKCGKHWPNDDQQAGGEDDNETVRVIHQLEGNMTAILKTLDMRLLFFN